MKKSYFYIIFLVVAAALSPLVFKGGFFVASQINDRFLKSKSVIVIANPANENNNNEITANEPANAVADNSQSDVATQDATTSPSQPENNIPAPADNNSIGNGVIFAVIGDTKTFTTSPSGNLGRAVKSLTKQNFDIAFVMGDLVSSCDGGSSCEVKYNSWKSVMAPILSKTYEIVGNHDRTGGSSADAVWQKEFTLPTNGPSGFSESVYSFNRGNSHFVVLNTEKPSEHAFNDVQKNWLEQDLAANKKENTFVFFHEPLFQMSQDKNDTMDANSKDRDVLWNILKKYNVTAVFNGHLHMFARKNQSGIQQIVVGDTASTADDVPQKGMTDYGLTGHHYSIVSVSGKEVDLKTYTVDGVLVNDFKF